jgi:polyhydroxyalkanoate synthesis regulator protein
VKTGEDLTRVTLTQIIMENAKDQPAGLPLELLRQLVMASDHVGQEFIMWYLKSAFDTYQKLQTAIQGGLSEVQSAALSPLSMMKKLVQRKTGQEPSEDNELEQLRARLAEVEARLKEKERSPKSSKSTA